ncbi:MAG: paraquat-inducible protein A [Pseudomonadota bacterium]
MPDLSPDLSTDFSKDELMACHECDLLHRIIPVPVRGKAVCTRCGALLYRNIPNSIEKGLALHLTALMLLIMTHAFPFMSLKLSGRIEENHFLSGAMALYRLGMGEVGGLVFVTSVLFPFLTIMGMLYILVPIKLGYRSWNTGWVFRMVRALMPWSLTAVFMLGVLIAIVKLMDLATIIPGISLYSFVGLMVALTAAQANLDPRVIWPPADTVFLKDNAGNTAAQQDLVSCHICSLLVPKTNDESCPPGNCIRCETPLHSRKNNSIARTWALIFAAFLLFFPANLYPVMTVVQFGKGHANTILSGVVQLVEEGMWVLALIIFFASIVVPILKLIVLAFLLIMIKKKSAWRSRDRTLLFRVTEIVGAWSMVDIYVVAILAGLVNFGFMSTVRPGIGVAFFGAVVVITIFAAHSFDPRLIWDNTKEVR